MIFLVDQARSLHEVHAVLQEISAPGSPGRLYFDGSGPRPEGSPSHSDDGR
ncbi:MAG: hypothetical protein ACJ8DI_20360 [Ktedonobacteraceae bacterium]